MHLNMLKDETNKKCPIQYAVLALQLISVDSCLLDACVQWKHLNILTSLMFNAKTKIKKSTQYRVTDQFRDFFLSGIQWVQT